LICRNENLLQQESYLFNKKVSSDPNPLDPSHAVILLKTQILIVFSFDKKIEILFLFFLGGGECAFLVQNQLILLFFLGKNLPNFLYNTKLMDKKGRKTDPKDSHTMHGHIIYPSD
jgi:hypothetical protein